MSALECVLEDVTSLLASIGMSVASTVTNTADRNIIVCSTQFVIYVSSTKVKFVNRNCEDVNCGTNE